MALSKYQRDLIDRLRARAILAIADGEPVREYSEAADTILALLNELEAERYRHDRLQDFERERRIAEIIGRSEHD